MDRRAIIALGAAAATFAVGLGVIFGRKALAYRPRLKQGDQVVLLGDSLGVGITKPLTELLASQGVTLVAVPRVGWTARQTAKLYQASDDLQGAAVVASLGSNDGALLDPSGEAADVQAIVDTAFARGAQRFLWIVPPNYAISSPPAPATPEKQQAFEALWSDPRVELLRASPEQLGPDRIHLPPAGYAELARQVASALV